MLAAAHRLRRSNEFAAVIRGGRRAGRGTVVVHLTIPDQTGNDQTATGEIAAGPPPTGGHRHAEPARAMGASALPARAGFVVSKAVGGAVVRNEVRRRLRHLVAERLGQLPPGSCLVVRALPGAGLSPYLRLSADLDAALGAARVPRSSRRRG